MSGGPQRPASIGDLLEPAEFTVTRSDLVRYAGASLDFNPIHWSDRAAARSELPGVIAHGMLVMALGGRYLTEWTGHAGSVVDYGVVFSRPVVVPDDDRGVIVTVSGKVVAVDQHAGTATVSLSVSADGQRVLGKSRGVVTIA